MKVTVSRSERGEYSITCDCEMILRNGQSVELAPIKPPCVWTQNDDGQWDTKCGNCYEFTNAGDTPRENRFQACPYCGGEIVENTAPDAARKD